jgi:hypothetical protein
MKERMINMTKIITQNDPPEPVEYELRFFKHRKLRAGFPCDSKGKVNLKKLPPQAQLNLTRLLNTKGYSKKVELRNAL